MRQANSWRHETKRSTGDEQKASLKKKKTMLDHEVKDQQELAEGMLVVEKNSTKSLVVVGLFRT
eukprot:6264732-Amphidinium_carterae.1